MAKQRYAIFQQIYEKLHNCFELKCATLHPLDSAPDTRCLFTAGTKMSLRGQMQINCTPGPQGKTENSSRAEQQTHAAYRRKAKDLRRSFEIFNRLTPAPFNLWRRSGTTHLTRSSKVSQRQPLCRLKIHQEPVIAPGSEVKQLKTKTPSKSWFCLGDGNWTLNMPAVKRPMDDQSWPTNHNTGWEVKLLF